MNKEFITYEHALALKELGFNEPCICFYDEDGYLFSVREQDDIYDYWTPAPSYSQAFRWFRETYNLKAYIIPIEYLDGTQETYQWNIFNKCHSGVEQFTYEEAENACLDKLIEIVKNK